MNIRPLLLAANGDERGAMQTYYDEKAREAQYDDKRNSSIAMVQKAKATSNGNQFTTVHRITKKLTGGSKPFDNTMRGVSDRCFIHDNEKYNRWKRHSTTIFNCVTSAKVPTLVDEKISYQRAQMK